MPVGVAARAGAAVVRDAQILGGVEQLAAAGKTSSEAKAALRGWSAFLRSYVLRLGFLDGVTGLRVADYNRRYTYEKWARLAKLRRS